MGSAILVIITTTKEPTLRCQNTIRMGVDTGVPCDHTASEEVSNGLPVCGCCMILGPLWEQVQREVNEVIETAAQHGQHSGLIRVGFTRDHQVRAQGVPVPQNDN